MPLDSHVKKPIYHNGEFPDLSRMDISEIEKLRRETSEYVNQTKLQLQLEEQNKQQQKEKEIQEKLNELKQLKEKLNKEQKNDS